MTNIEYNGPYERRTHHLTVNLSFRKLLRVNYFREINFLTATFAFYEFMIRARIFQTLV